MIKELVPDPHALTPRLLIIALICSAALIAGVIILSERNRRTPVPEPEVYVEMPDTLTNWDLLILSIALTESNYDPNAVGTSKDQGILQITPIYVKEINRLLGSEQFKHDDAFDPELSVLMFNTLQFFKNPNHDLDTAIRYHNKASYYKKRVYENLEVIKNYETLRQILINAHGNEVFLTDYNPE